jgi:flagellar P-ring protein precursor FlgI
MRAALALLPTLLLAVALPSHAVRVKDIASFRGVRENQVIGYGLVVGLNGTGDRTGTEFTVRSLASMLAKLGIGVDPETIDVKNVAAVMVTSNLPAFSRNGSRIDALISSIGDAASIEGGTLLMTPLFATDGEVYAIAQGPVSVGGFSAGGGAGGGGSSVQKNHPTVGRIVNGATIERELVHALEGQELQLALGAADFTTALRAASAINERLGARVAHPQDAGTLRIRVPEARGRDLVRFVAEIEAVEFEPDARAVVVLNERTGTVVMGADVRISEVAVSHRSLSITVGATISVSQPAPFSDGETVEVRNDEVEAIEESAALALVGGGVSIAELVRGRNAMGVTPRDLIAILQTIKASGALAADLEIL